MYHSAPARCITPLRVGLWFLPEMFPWRSVTSQLCVDLRTRLQGNLPRNSQNRRSQVRPPRMGGDQSRQQTEEEQTEQQTEQQTEETTTTDSVSEATQGEQPQCMMGGRQVDDMCYMISCTNWY